MIVSWLTPADWAAPRALSTTLIMSCGAMNCAFLMFTGFPLAATAWMKSVWRARKAGVWSTSTTSATGPVCGMSWSSVRIGTLSSSRTLARILSPSSSPGPRKLLSLLRLALSKLDLKMNNMPSLSVMALSRSAVRSCSSWLSTTHGPAMRNKGWSSPTSRPSSCIGAYLGERIDDRHRLPVAERIFRCKIGRERLARMDPPSDENGVESHQRGPEDVGLEPVANRQHLFGTRIAGEVERVVVDRLVRLAVPPNLSAERLVNVGNRAGAR